MYGQQGIEGYRQHRKEIDGAMNHHGDRNIDCAPIELGQKCSNNKHRWSESFIMSLSCPYKTAYGCEYHCFVRGDESRNGLKIFTHSSHLTEELQPPGTALIFFVPYEKFSWNIFLRISESDMLLHSFAIP